MSEKVACLPGVTLKPKGPNVEVIEHLQRLMDMAQAGVIQSIAVAAIDDETMIHTWKHRYSGAPVYSMLGAVSYLKSRVEKDIED